MFARQIGDECMRVPQICEDTLTTGGLSVMYGPSNSGKSYLALHLACSIAEGTPWLGRRTIAGTVLYVAGEGASSIKMRLAAYMRHHRIFSLAVAVVGESVDLLNPLADTQRVIDATRLAEKECQMPVVLLIVVDTLARAFGGGNENQSDDMGAVIQNADRIRLETGAHVLFVHHSGKDESKGSRGHSSLRAATDTEIEVSDSGNGIHTAEVVKQRDLASLGQRLSGRFVPVVLGADQWGKEQTACVVEDTESRPKEAKVTGKYQKVLLDKLRRAGPMTRAEAMQFLEEAGAAKRSRYSAIDSLLLAGIIEDTIIGLRAKE